MNTRTYFLAASLFAIATSCKEDHNEPVTPVAPNAVQFETEESSFVENSDVKVFTINLATPATADGMISIDVNTQQQNSITTVPETSGGKVSLPITRGNNKATFSVAPVNNSTLDGSKSVVFKIQGVSAGLSIGSRRQSTLTITDDEQPVLVNFLANSSTVEEDKNGEEKISIALSAAAPGTGQLQVSVQSEDATYGEHFTTVPPALNGTITFAITPGLEKAEIRVIPVNDTRINSNRHISMTITHASGAIARGTVTGHGVTVKDDELKGVTKSYSTSGGGWSTRRYFAYNESGLLSKVYWEQYTPGYTGGSYTYQYNGQQLEKMIEADGSETIYTNEGGRIIKAEKFRNGVLRQYTLYGYDDAGNVGEAAHFYRQPSGEMEMGLLFVYLYYLDGNLYKQLSYNPNVEEGEEPALISTRTFGNYLQVDNPFPMVEILPNKSTQKKLPGSYRVEENGKDITYTLTYEFDMEGKVRRRTATSSEGRETSEYSFYK